MDDRVWIKNDSGGIFYTTYIRNLQWFEQNLAKLWLKKILAFIKKAGSSMALRLFEYPTSMLN